MEKWAPVVGFEDAYRVSNYGKLCSIDRELPSGRWGHVKRKGQLISTKISRTGREIVGLRLNGKRTWRGVHQIVCEAFHGPKPSPKHQVAHFPDRDPLNNRAENLRWATSLENHNDRRIHQTTFPGEKNFFAQLREEDVREIRRLYRRGSPRKPGNQKELSDMFGVGPAQIQSIANHKSWQHVV